MFSSYAFAPLSLIVPLSAVSVIGKGGGGNSHTSLSVFSVRLLTHELWTDA